MQNEIRFRVRDHMARNRSQETVSCDLYYVADGGKESKLTSVTLKRESGSSDLYSGTSGTWSTEHQFTHGTIAKVVYKSPALRLPLSTWYVFYYH